MFTFCVSERPTKPDSSTARSRCPRACVLVARRQKSGAASAIVSGGLPHRAPVCAQGPRNGPWMTRCAGFHRQVVEPVHFAPYRQPPADCRRGMAFGQAGQIGADDRRRGAPGRSHARRTVAKMRPAWPGTDRNGTAQQAGRPGTG